MKYYNGVKEKDLQGIDVELGGSMVFNLQDAANTFGLGKDGLDRYKIVYTTFGDILSKMYPDIMPAYPAYNKVVDKSFVQSVVSNHPELLSGEAIKIEYSNNITSEVSSKSYAIQFETGSAVISYSSYPLLDEILKSATVAEGLKLGIYGHTDNVGQPDANQALSDRRAKSVAEYLVGKGLATNRIETRGFGDAKPLASNSTSEGRAKNRRVQIVLGD